MRDGKAKSNGIELYYEDWGTESDPAILMVCGMSTQLIYWPDAMVEHFVEQGFRVIRFDNRETGLSDRSTVKKAPPVVSSFIKAKLGLKVSADYDLHTLVKDAIGLLDALGIQQAHWLGFSMGGMISQLAAAHYPERVLTLTSIMSSTNDHDLPSPKLLTLANLFMPPFGKSDDDLADAIIRVFWNLRSPDFVDSRDEYRDLAYRILDRSRRPMAGPMHMMAIMATGGFGKDLKRVKAPTLVIHGTKDPLVLLAGGKRSAACIQDSKLLVIPGMGHDFPNKLVPRLNAEITAHIQGSVQLNLNQQPTAEHPSLDKSATKLA